MIHFFGDANTKVFAVQTHPNDNGQTPQELNAETVSKLSWLFGNQPKIEQASIDAFFVGARAAMITPWSTNAVEITQNMGIEGIIRIEEFESVDSEFKDYDPMISEKFYGLNQDVFTINIKPESIENITDIASYNAKEGLALSEEEINYLNDVSVRIGRPLTDSEVFGFSQVNSEHCRHKIFNGTFVIDGEEQPTSLFKLIKETSKQNPNDIV
ncbi:MAG: phosphoribosylformylglycinamidine synthase, partial [Bacteroidota bacterium]